LFIGHYAVAYALRPIEKRLSLGWLFIAVMLVDILWSGFILLGIEQARILEHPAIAVPYEFISYPFSHSLLAAFFWAGLTFVLLRWIPLADGTTKVRVATVMAIAVLSHWFCDFLVHEPELPLWSNAIKVGLGLWDYPLVAYVLEALMFIVGVGIYLRNTRGRTFGGRWGMVIFAAMLFLLFTLTTFGGGVPPGMTTAAVIGIVMQIAFAVIAGWLDGKRRLET
jgi:hypothetical protein